MIHNHDPKALSQRALDYVFSNAQEGVDDRRSSRINYMDKPCSTVSSVWHKGVPYGLFYPVEEREPQMKPTLDALPKLPSNGKKLVSLFSGGGLLDLGFIHAGYEIIFANDFDKAPCVAYRHNIGNHIHHGDVTSENIQSAIPVSGVDGLIGGPPCQDYSVAGKGAGEDGERGKLVWAYMGIIDRVRPKFFLFENVKGLVGKKHRHTLDALIEGFKAIGYNVTWKVLSAWDYGVAQKRERVFIVGIRQDLGFEFEFPQPEEYKPVLRDAIGDLPEPGIPLSDVQQAYLDRNPASVEKNRPVTMEEPSRTIPAVIGKGVPYGLFVPDNHTERDYWTPPSEYTYDQANRVQSMDQPSNTIPAHHNSGQPIHPIAKPRRFTVRECLRIQSVPDTYVFPDSMSLSAMYKVAGNGVPSRLAYHLAKALNEQLDKERVAVQMSML